MAGLSITGQMKVSTLQEGFLGELGLTLRVYDGRSFADPTQTLAQVREDRPEPALDAQSHDASDKATRQMTMEFNGDTWNASGLMPGASLLHPVLVRLRDDKSVSTEEIRFAQILERCFVAKASTSDSGADLPVSKLLRREVYIKEAKGKTAVRKLLVWKTNKEKVSDEPPVRHCQSKLA